MTYYGVPYRDNTQSKNIYAMSSADTFGPQALKCTILLNLSTNVTIVLFPFDVSGSEVIKSIVTLSQGRLGGGNGCNNPAGRCVNTLVA
jgi:hypothetical protein